MVGFSYLIMKVLRFMNIINDGECFFGESDQ